MESVKFKRISDENGQITGLEIEGLLVLENSQQLKEEILEVVDNLSDKVQISIANVEELDLSCIQIIVAFIRRMDDMNVTCQFNWNLNEHQKSLLQNVGLSNELLMNS